jgi:hypothetical protein
MWLWQLSSVSEMSHSGGRRIQTKLVELVAKTIVALLGVRYERLNVPNQLVIETGVAKIGHKH